MAVSPLHDWKSPACTSRCERRLAVPVGKRHPEWEERHDLDGHHRWGAANVAAGAATVVRSGPLTFDWGCHEARVGGVAVHLSPTERRLLCVLLNAMPRIVTRDDLLYDVWGSEYAGAYQLLRVVLHRLRARLGAAGRLIESEEGYGYRIAEHPSCRPAEFTVRVPWIVRLPKGAGPGKRQRHLLTLLRNNDGPLATADIAATFYGTTNRDTVDAARQVAVRLRERGHPVVIERGASGHWCDGSVRLGVAP